MNAGFSMSGLCLGIFRGFVGVGVLAASAIPLTASAQGPDTNVPLGFPLTAPNPAPMVMGVGHDDGAIAAFDSPTVLFTNFDGATLNSGCGNDSHNDCSTLAGLFGGGILPFSGTYADRAAIVQSAREDVEDFGVIVVGERPPSNQPYAMVMVGNGVSGEQDFGGVAPFIDCGNSDPNLTSFALELGGFNVTATIIHQEAAHTWGLEHVNDPTDNLHPTAGGFNDPKYNDVCNKIVSDTDLNPSNGQCNSVHTMFCNSGNQNSYREMLALFGPPIPDQTAPTVTIDSPLEGEELPCPADFDLTLTLTDDRRPHSMIITILLDGSEVTGGLYVDQTHKFPIHGGISPGPHTWRVEAVDESGNPASAEVNFTLVTNPNDPACAMGGASTSDSDSGTDGGSGGSGTTGPMGEGDDEKGCACTTTAIGAPWAAGLLVLPMGFRRRHPPGCGSEGA